MNNKVAIIIPYFGHQPLWFDYFVLSCKHNPEIDWFFFTDCLESIFEVPNLKYIKMTLPDFNKLAKTKLGFNVNVINAYKLCDYKPTYGKIFFDFIKDYTFWGYGDIDLVYGDILKFLPTNWQTKLDVISNHQHFIPGHFCILKNVSEVNELFTEIPSHQEILLSDNYCGFDEKLLSIPVRTNTKIHDISKWIGVRQHLVIDNIVSLKARFLQNKTPFKAAEQKQEVETKDFTSLVQSMNRKGAIKASFSYTYSCDISFSKKRLKAWEVAWKNGRLFDSAQNKEIMYFHFQLSKTKKKFKIKPLKSQVSGFYISPNGIDF